MPFLIIFNVRLTSKKNLNFHPRDRSSNSLMFVKGIENN
jgi:hypothetical protein